MDNRKYLNYIEENYTEEDILNRIDDQILEYVDANRMLEENIDDSYEYYDRYCSNEAETDVIDELVREVEFAFDVKFETDYFMELGHEIAEYAGIGDKY